MDKGLAALFEKLEAQGWELRETKKGWFAVPPDKGRPMVAIHGTPSDHRAWRNMLALLKRSGYIEG